MKNLTVFWAMGCAVIFGSTNNLVADSIEIVAIEDATVDSNGALGQEIITDAEFIETSMSGSSNVSDGLFEFDLSILPAGATIDSVTLKLRTAQIISNTSNESTVEFYGFIGNGQLEVEDQGAGGVLVQSEIFQSGILDNVELEVQLSNIGVFNTAISDGSSDDFITIRSETENFVLMRVDSLESSE